MRFMPFAGLACTLAAVALIAQPQGHWMPIVSRPAAAVERQPLKVMGASSCSTAKCHGGTEKKKGEYSRYGNENTVWTAKDKHAKSFGNLTDKKGTKIAKAMGIASPDTSDRCLKCHAMNVPEAERGKKFDLTDGNTCEQCHGPAEKWLDPHSEKGWTKAKSIAIGALDSRDYYDRADTCIPCHVGIDHEMIEAGHPYPTFELDTFSATMPPHWDEPDPWRGAKIWAVGEAVALRDSLNWVSRRAKSKAPDKYVQSAWQEAHGRLVVLRHVAEGKCADSLKGLVSAMDDLEKAAASKDLEKLAGATAAAAKADALAKALNAADIGKDDAIKVMKALPGDAAEIGDGGFRTAEQITMSLDTLSKDAAKGGMKSPALDKAINSLYDNLPEDQAKFVPAAFSAALKAVKVE